MIFFGKYGKLFSPVSYTPLKSEYAIEELWKSTKAIEERLRSFQTVHVHVLQHQQPHVVYH